MKHTNIKVIICLYTYNRQIKYINGIKNLRKTIKKIYLKKIQNYLLYKWFYFKYSTIYKIKFNYIKLIKYNKTIYKYKKIKEICNFFLTVKLKKKVGKKKYFNMIFYNTKKLENLNKYKINILQLNEKKFYMQHLFKLSNIIENLYNKQVEFRIINLKKLYLNSDIFSESIAIKLKNRKNSLLKVLKKALKMAKVPFFNKYLFFTYKLYGKFFSKDNTFINTDTILYKNKDILNEFLYKVLSDKNQSYSFFNINDIEKNVFNKIKHKKINGIRLEASGRLTRRLIASRSIFKFKYKGNIKNMDSSIKGLPRVLLKGHIKSNIQYTLINSKTRNGSFGLKGWVSSY